MNCKKCYGHPCVCEEEKTYVPVWTEYMWLDKENMMVHLNDIPMSPRLKRMWDQAVEL